MADLRPGLPPPAARRACRATRARGEWVLAGALVAALGATLVWRPAPMLVWNASASSPVGLYGVGPVRGIRRGDMALAWPPAAARDLGAARRYLPRNVPLVKHVAAVAGDRVCADGTAMLVNGQWVAERRTVDPPGRPMPWWEGCETLGGGDVLLLSPAAPLAFDGRYFGISRAEHVIGRARLLWPG